MFEAGNPVPLYDIADVPALQKSYVWNVPNDPALAKGRLYVSVSGAGTPPAGPGFSNEMGGNGQPFEIAKDLPQHGAGHFGQQAEGEFKEQVVSETGTVTVSEVTGTTTVMVTVTDNAAGAVLRSREAASYAALMVVPLLVLLF